MVEVQGMLHGSDRYERQEQIEMVTDIALGYDHITVATAAAAGRPCYVTPVT